MVSPKILITCRPLHGTNFKSNYVEFMNNLIEKGYAQQCDNKEKDPEGKTWYILHHGVYHPKKANYEMYLIAEQNFMAHVK